MKTLIMIFVSLSTLTATHSAATDFFGKEPDPRFAKWAAVKTPTKSAPQAIGAYAGGCLAGGKMFPNDGPGYLIVRQNRNKNFGHPKLLNYLNDLAARSQRAGLPKLILGDLVGPRGGPFLFGHNSHQSGLDVDISLSVAVKEMTPEERLNFVDPSFVENRRYLTKDWTDFQTKLVELAANSSEVARIFVSPGIKKFYCDTNPKAPWLHRLRPWWGHDDHIHVRLHCPSDSPNCQAQAALDPKDNGCGAELASWFTTAKDKEWEDMLKEWNDPNTPPRPFPSIPAKCDAVLAAH